jgi:hypothetical protein
MRPWFRFAAMGALALGMVLALASPSSAQSRAHVYLLRGLMNIFSLGMDTLSEELNRRGVYATVHNHSDWMSLANAAAANYKAGKEGPIILIGHSLGADAVMEMAAYLGAKGVPVALVVPFDGTQSFSAPPNVARVMNLTQRDYAFMRAGPGFHGSLVNVDVRSDPSIDHLNIDKSPRLHARVISEVLAVTGGGGGGGGHHGPQPATAKLPASEVDGAARGAPVGGETKREGTPAAPAQPSATPAPAVKSGDGALNSAPALSPVADSGAPLIAVPERRGSARAGSDAPVMPQKSAVPPQQPAGSGQLPN